MLWFVAYFRKELSENCRFLLKTLLNSAKLDHNIGFEENANFFRKSAKFAESSDHNIALYLMPQYVLITSDCVDCN
jgi:hypothetical protein